MLEPIHRGDCRTALLGRLGGDRECPSHANAEQRKSGSQQHPRREPLTVAKQGHDQSRMGQQLLVERAADVRSQLLVEELLELERALPLRRIQRIKRGLGQRSSSAAMIRVESPIDCPSMVSTGVVEVSPVRCAAFQAWKPGSSERRMCGTRL